MSRRRGPGETDLEYHARRFAQSGNPGRVLRKYFSKTEEFAKPELQRHIAHVCAWIALAMPRTKAAEVYRDGGHALSPVILLSRMLKVLGRSPLGDRVRLALAAVSSSCTLVLDAEPSIYGRRQAWVELQRFLPKRWHTQETTSKEDGSRVDGIEASDVQMFKRIHRLNKRMLEWRQKGLSEREEAIITIEGQFMEVVSSWQAGNGIDTIMLRTLLYKAVAALSRPTKRLDLRSGGAQMEDQDAQRLQISAELQKRIRDVLVKGLVLWRNELLLEDLQIQPLLASLRSYICNFEARYASGVQDARAGRQWRRLKKLVCAGLPRGGAGVKRDKPKKQFWSSVRGGVFVPTDRVRALPYIRELEEAVALECTGCQHKLTSRWHFVGAGKQKDEHRVIVPHNGCKSCRAQYRSLSHVRAVRDKHNNFDICDHKRVRRWCKICVAPGSSRAMRTDIG